MTREVNAPLRSQADALGVVGFVHGARQNAGVLAELVADFFDHVKGIMGNREHQQGAEQGRGASTQQNTPATTSGLSRLMVSCAPAAEMTSA